MGTVVADMLDIGERESFLLLSVKLSVLELLLLLMLELLLVEAVLVVGLTVLLATVGLPCIFCIIRRPCSSRSWFVFYLFVSVFLDLL